MGRLVTGGMVAALLAAFAVAASPASGDGLPVPVDASRSGVTVTGNEARFVTVATPRGTVVERIQRAGGRVLSSTFIRGNYTVPAVALDGSASGLSADGSTLALIQPRARFLRARTSFAIIDTSELDLRERITLRGDFSFDAISPDGELLYLVNYLSPRDITRYEVRVYDVDAGRLIPEPIVDPSEPDERMGGLPLARATSPHGRWAYTLYDGAGKDPFVHALDTVGRTAVCVELRGVDSGQLFDSDFGDAAGGRKLTIERGSSTLAVIDTESFRVSYPKPDVAASDPGEGGGIPWLLVAIGGALALIVGALVIRRRGGDEPMLPADPLASLTDDGQPDARERLGVGRGDSADGALDGDVVAALPDHAHEGV